MSFNFGFGSGATRVSSQGNVIPGQDRGNRDYGLFGRTTYNPPQVVYGNRPTVFVSNPSPVFVSDPYYSPSTTYVATTSHKGSLLGVIAAIVLIFLMLPLLMI